MKHTDSLWNKREIFKIFFSVAVCLFMCAPTSGQAKTSSSPQQVLIVQSAYQGYPWTDSLDRGIQEVFAAAPESFEFIIEYIDTKRNHERFYFQELHTLWQLKYRNRRIDLIIVCDNEAYDFIVNGRDRLFKDIPLVFAGYIGYNPALLDGKKNITGVIQETDIVATIDIALRLHPKTKKIVFVAPGAPAFRMVWLEGLPEQYANRVQLMTITSTNLSAIKTEIASLGSDIVVIPLNSGIDAHGTYLPFNKFVSYLAKDAHNPVYALWDIALDEGIVGGKMVSGELQGRAAATLALKILRGTPVSEVPVVIKSPNQYMFDWNQLQRFNIDLKTLPKDAVLINAPVSFYKANKTLVHLTAGVVFVLIFLVILLGIAVASLKRAQKKLLLSDAILKQMPDAVVLTDLEGKILRWQGKAEEIFGYSALEALDHYIDLVCQDTIPKELKARSRDGMRAPESFHAEIFCIKKNGIRIPVEITAATVYNYSGKPIGIIEIYKNITQRKKIETDLKRLAMAMEHSSDTIFITDTSGKILYANPAFEKVSGYAREEILGEQIAHLESQAKDLAFGDAVRNTISRGESWSGKIRNTKKDGSLYTEEATISPVFSNTGTIINYVAVKRDITERILLEKQLRHAQTMESIGTLAGGIAHDFNNILTAIIGYSELAMGQIEKESFIEECLYEILHAGNRAKDLVKQILTFARRSESGVASIQIGSIAKEVAKFIRSSIPSTIEIRQVIHTEAQVLADPAQLYQIFMNLFTNAAQAMEDSGGILSLDVDEIYISHPETLEEISLTPGNWVVIKVEDTGTGIPDHIMKNIFEPYFTTKPMGEGTGLGLSVVYGAVKNMKGKISVTSELHKGTLFTIYLPKFENNEPAEIKEDVAADYSGKERILVVDDEKIITKLLKELLERKGYSVATYVDPLKALAYFKSNADAIDMVLTDMTMPHMMGDEFSKRLLEIKPEIPIICCTGFSKKMDKVKAENLGIKALVEKPISQNNLLCTVRTIFDEEK